MPAKTEVDVFFKSKAPEKDKNAAANTAEVMERIVQQQHSVAEQVAASPPVPKTGTGSCIGSGMSIVGNIECKGQATSLPGHEGSRPAARSPRERQELCAPEGCRDRDHLLFRETHFAHCSLRIGSQSLM